MTSEANLPPLLREAARAERLAVDLEASGLFSYRARLCTVQMAWDGGQRVAIVDTLAVTPEGLRDLLGGDGPVKIVHDVAFDARMLAEAGVALGNVHDTAIAAQMLGRAALGLAALLEAELGVHITKAMQQHDWRERPLCASSLAYLQADVVHLEALESRLWGEVVARGIADEVLEETGYRIACAAAAARTPPSSPPYARIRGVERLAERDLAALMAIAEVREREAERRDVPPFRVASNEALVALARARPHLPAQIDRFKGIDHRSPHGAAFATALAQALTSAPQALPASERARFERPRVAATVVKARRARESRLLAWRRAQATDRGVGEQVILPGHCAKEAVVTAPETLEDLARVPGIGAFRVQRDGESILRALRGDGADVDPGDDEGDGRAEASGPGEASGEQS